MVKSGVIAIMLSVGLVGCANLHTPFDDGYDFGDVSRTVYGGASHLMGLRLSYCTEGDPVVREALLMAIHSIAPKYPEAGVCTNLLEARHGS